MTTDTGDTGTSPEGGDTGQSSDGESWYGGYDEETRGWLDNRGMLKLNANAALEKAIQGHRNAEKSLGVPQDRRLDLPADMATEGAMDPIYNRLGRPDTADGYEFTGAATDGPDKAFDDWAKNAFHGAGLSAANADKLHASFKEFITGTVAQSEQDMAIQAEADAQELKREWGPTYERNKNLAEATVNKLGLTPDDFDGIKAGLGNNAAYKLLQKIGAGFGEDSFVEDTGVGPGGPTTPEGAREEIKALKKDKGFVDLLRAGDVNARKKWDSLHRLAG